MESNKFIIVAPPYSVRSGGVMVLHDLCEALNRNGYQASIVFMHSGNAIEQNFQFGISNDPNLYRSGGIYHFLKNDAEALEVFANGTVIYPDLITGNPLGALNTVRYILNFNSLNFSGDFILAYSKIYSKYKNFVLTKPFHHHSFSDIGTASWSNRNLDLTYVGKGSVFTDCHIIKNTILLERDYPRDKDQLALLLKQCRFFFTWDCVSATNFDAMMCGAIPILLHDKQISRQDINKMEIGAFPRINFSSVEELPGGLQYDQQEVDADVANFKKSYHHLINTWDRSVKKFVEYYLDLKSKNISFIRPEFDDKSNQDSEYAGPDY